MRAIAHRRHSKSMRALPAPCGREALPIVFDDQLHFVRRVTEAEGSCPGLRVFLDVTKRFLSDAKELILSIFGQLLRRAVFVELTRDPAVTRKAAGQLRERIG
jgi:hypothetical protein